MEAILTRLDTKRRVSPGKLKSGMRACRRGFDSPRRLLPSRISIHGELQGIESGSGARIVRRLELASSESVLVKARV